MSVTHHPDQQCFEMWVDGHRCELDYLRQGQVVVITHTGVPGALQGRGLAAELVEAALRWIRSEGLRLRPQCSYVAAHVQRHREWLDLLA